jgi:hypothetical protein
MGQSDERAPSGRAITEGLIISVFKEEGPTNIYNSSPLNENDAFNLSIKNWPVLGSDIPAAFGEINSYGPIPTPKRPYHTIAFSLLLKAKLSSDERLLRLGSMVVFWVITSHPASVKYTGVLRRVIRRALNQYHIVADSDLLGEGIAQKIDEKLRIIEGTMVASYVTEGNRIESFLDLNLIPQAAPIIIIDDSSSQIRVLLRGQTSPTRKIELREIVEEYKKRFAKGAAYKVEFISEPLSIQLLLSKLGYISESDVGAQFRVWISDKVAFEDLDEFFDSRLSPLRQTLVGEVMESIRTEKSLNLIDLSSRVGLSSELIEQILLNAISSGLIGNAEVQNGVFFPRRKT